MGAMSNNNGQKTMKAVRIQQYGDPNVMRVEELQKPKAGMGQAIIRVKVASVNFLDIQQRRGELVNQSFYKDKAGVDASLPITVGSQAVGVVEEIGPDVKHVKVGDRVACFGGSGTYATHVLTNANFLIPLPDALNFEQAAAGLNQGFLAYAFTHYAYPIQKGDWCLIQAAAGGLGLLICQMAKLCGGRVIGVTSKEEKAGYVKEAGAEEVIISSKADIAKEVRQITEGKGVNVVYDGVGKDTFEANLDSLGIGGYFIMYGQSSGFVPPFDLMRLQEKGSIFITRTNGLPYRKYWPQYIQDLTTWIKEGKISIRVDRKYPLSEAAEAHAAIERREVSGRILLVP